MGSFSIWHWLILILVVLLLFGRGKISDLMGDMAKGIKSFKKGLADDPSSEATDETAKSIEQKASEAAKAEPEKVKS
jgi:sec-independent protein translocase protein TatA